jgi:hypothetical protein
MNPNQAQARGGNLGPGPRIRTSASEEVLRKLGYREEKPPVPSAGKGGAEDSRGGNDVIYPLGVPSPADL